MKIHSILCLALAIAFLASPAWAGCGKWVVRENPNYDYLSDADFDQAVASSTGAAATLNSDGTTKESSDEDLELEKAQKEEEEELKKNDVPKEDPIPDLGGEWRILLDMKIDGQDKQKMLDLILIQTTDRLQGYGTLIEEGADLPATATGSISDDSVSLIVSLVEQKKQYKLNLAIAKDGLKGIYELSMNEKLAGSGNATASRSSS